MNIFQGNLRLTLAQDVACDTKKFRFTIDGALSLDGKTELTGPLSFKPGQFLSLQFTDKAWRSYSIASSPIEKEIEFVVRLISGGTASNIWNEVEIGDCFPFKGPFGHFGLSDKKDVKLVFCATSTGIAPFRSMILHEAQADIPRSMTLLYGGKDLKHLAYLDELETWSKKLNIKLGLSRELDSHKLGPYGSPCRITEFLKAEDYDDQTEFYICGNGNMVQSVEQILLSQGIHKDQIFRERFN